LRHPLSHVGTLLDAAALEPSPSARNHLLWLAHSQGLTARRVDEVIGQAGQQSSAPRQASGFQLGMRQRLAIAALLFGDPPVIMLDEPFNGHGPGGHRADARLPAIAGRPGRLSGELPAISPFPGRDGSYRVSASGGLPSRAGPAGDDGATALTGRDHKTWMN